MERSGAEALMLVAGAEVAVGDQEEQATTTCRQWVEFLNRNFDLGEYTLLWVSSAPPLSMKA